MEKFLGILFCGGRGKRLGEITKFISKSFIPVYDKPVFKFGLEMLMNSKHIDDILVLTNESNDKDFMKQGLKTLIQDDKFVSDMFSGWDYIREVTATKKNGVLVPSDNISMINVDGLIEQFKQKNSDFLFSIKKIPDRKKLSQMGSFDPGSGKYFYKNPDSNSEFGVIAPYIIRNDGPGLTDDKIFEKENADYIEYEDDWFDIGDYDSITEASAWRKKQLNGSEAIN